MTNRCLALILVALGSVACGHHDVASHRFEAEEVAVFDVDIDTDVGIEVTSGEGAGVFLEYFTGGEWELFTTCDTEISGIPCEFDIFVSVPLGEKISKIEGLDLELEDELVLVERGVLSAFFYTASDFDRVQFRTSPGQTVRLDVLLDGVPDPEVMFWNGYGTLQFAAPSNPLDVTPTSP